MTTNPDIINLKDHWQRTKADAADALGTLKADFRSTTPRLAQAATACKGGMAFSAAVITMPFAWIFAKSMKAQEKAQQDIPEPGKTRNELAEATGAGLACGVLLTLIGIPMIITIPACCGIGIYLGIRQAKRTSA